MRAWRCGPGKLVAGRMPTEAERAKRRAYYEANAEEIRAKARERSKSYQHPDPEAQRTRKREWARANRGRYAPARAAAITAVRAETFAVYGGSCYCCGEDHPTLLTIDHVDDNGAEHRRSLPSSSTGHRFYRWLRRQGWPEGYQVACFNCNTGRHINGGICPHRER
jgi:hypothetical protein